MITIKTEQPFIIKRILSVLFILLFFSINSYAAIVVNPSISVVANSVANGSTLNTASYSIPAGSNRYLLVAISFQNRNGRTVTGVTYNNVALTSLVNTQNGTNTRVELWRLNQTGINTSGGTGLIRVSFSGIIEWGAGVAAVSFSGVDQNTPFLTPQISNGNSASLRLGVSANTGEIVFAVAAQEDETGNFTVATAGGHTSRMLFNTVPNGGRNTRGAAATKVPAASGTITMGWDSPSGGNQWSMAGVSVRPVPPPTISSASASCPFSSKKITVVYSADVASSMLGAGNPANYTLTGGSGGAITAATVSGKTVTLTATNALTASTAYTLTASNITDTSSTPITGLNVNFTSPNCTGLSGSCVTYKDAFSFSSYSNNDSDAGYSWLNNWTETGDGTTSPSAGNIQIVNGELFFDGNTTSSIQRGLNLNPSTYDAAYLSFRYRTTNNWEDSDTMTVSVSGSTVATLINDPSPNPVTQRINITSNISSNTVLNFARTTNNGNEDAYLDNVEVIACSLPPTMSSATASCPLSLKKISVLYSKDVASTMLGAGNYANYTLTGGISITAATVSGSTVTLTTSAALSPLTSYTVTANNITTTSGTPITGLNTTFTTTNCTELLAYYQFDEETWDGTGQVINQVGATFTGTRIGNAAPIYPGKVCNAAYIPANVTEANSNAVDTGIDVNGDIGSKGSINFWYQSDTDWVGGADRLLFDASDDTTGTNNDKYFYLIVTNTGKLNFGLEDSNDADIRYETVESFAKTATDWVHIGVSWDLTLPGGAYSLKVFVDGVEKTLQEIPGLPLPATTNGTLGNLKTLYLGDNRSTYTVPGHSQNSAGGRIDEARIYNIAIPASQMSADRDKTHPCTAIACSYRDDFSTASYANNDGSIPWLTNWVETDATTPNSPSTGYVSITGGSLVLQNNTPSVSATIPKIVRDFSLSGVTSAKIYYTFKLTGGVDAADSVTVKMSDGTNPEVTIETITGLTDGTYSRNFPINAPLLGQNNIKLSLSINGAGQYTASGETISFLYLAIYPNNTCSINTLHHLQMSHDGAGLTCEPENIKIKACADPGCVLSYSSAVTINTSPTTSPTTWIPANPITIPASTETTVQLKHPTLTPAGGPQTIPLNITSSTPAPANSTVVCKDLLGNTLANCDIKFYDAGFVFNTGSTIPSQIACEESASPIYITAKEKDPGTGECTTLFNGQQKQISFSITPVASPTADVITMTTTSPVATKTFSSTAPQNVALDFTGGTASFKLKHDNAGKFTLNASLTDSGLTFVGTSPFVVRPHSFFIDANTPSDTPLTSANHTGSEKWKASDNFKFRLRGQCAPVGTTPGKITTNYVPTKAEMWVELALPNPGNNSNFSLQGTDYLSLATAPATWNNISSKFYQGAITNIVSPNPTGTASYADAAFHEVGVLKLHVRDTDYFGATLPEQTLTIGRFTPHHFDTTVAPACSTATPFTYSGQPFGVTATAKNNAPSPVTTQNYTGAYAFNTTLSNAAVSDIANFNSSNVILAANYLNGTASKNDVIYTFPVKDTTATDILLRANDADTAGAIGVTEGSNNIRSGRIRLENVFGPVTSNLTMPLYTEYYLDDGFTTNTDDSCTAYDAAIGTLTNPTGDLLVSETSVSGAGTVNAGTAFLTFTAPGAGNEGSVNLLLSSSNPTNPTWLNYPWGIDCDANGSTTEMGACGTASFGLYRGDDRIIYWREIF